MQIIYRGRLALAALLVPSYLVLQLFCLPVLAGTGFMEVPIKGQWIPSQFDFTHPCANNSAQNNPKGQVMGQVEMGLVKAKLQLVMQEDTDSLVVTIKLPDGVILKSGQLTQHFTSLHAKQELNIDYVFNIVTQQAKQVVATATLANEEKFKMGRAFVLAVNPQAKQKADTQIIQNEQGERLIVY